MGKGEIIVHIYSSSLRNLYIPQPPINEQIEIATYLEHKTAEIDALISKKERLIELLQEEQTAIINQAVTKGLDPNVPMKDSGIEWLGQIPKHWGMTRINRIIKVKDGTHDTPEYKEPGRETLPLITSKDFINGEIDFSNAKHISREDHDTIIKRSNTEEGDILMSMIGGNIGNMVRVKTNRQFSIKNVALFKTCNDPTMAQYLYYILKSPILKHQIDVGSRGGAQGFLSLGDLRSLIFFVIPLEEMGLIVRYVKQQEDRIGNLISKIQKEIQLIDEYKMALISEVVTGKIDVREEAQMSEL